MIIAVAITPLVLNALNLECKIVYHADTVKKNGVYQTKGAPNSSVILNIYDDSKKIFVKTKGSNESSELIFISKGMGANYFAEITSVGNSNMYTFYDNGLLTVSKSYDMFGMMKMSVQDQYKCK